MKGIGHKELPEPPKGTSSNNPPKKDGPIALLDELSSHLVKEAGLVHHDWDALTLILARWLEKKGLIIVPKNPPPVTRGGSSDGS